jgi:hypothetical protein
VGKVTDRIGFPSKVGLRAWKRSVQGAVATWSVISVRYSGAGPRDGLILGLSRRKGWSVSRTRTGLEVLVLILGWVLGGAVGIERSSLR